MEALKSQERSLGPIRLAVGVTPFQVMLFLGVILIANCTNGFQTLMQPLVINSQLHVPLGKQGVVAGLLGTAQQGAILLFISLAGFVADRIGRRAALAGALAIFAVSLFLYPFVSAIWALLMMRFVWGVGFTGWTAGGATRMMDLPHNDSRGKFISFMLIAQAAVAAVVTAGFSSQLPSWFKASGLSDSMASRWAFWVFAAISLAGAILGVFCLSNDKGRIAPPANRPKRSFLIELTGDVREVIAHARVNPRFAIVLIIGFVIRTESVIVASFLGLWVVNAARAHGIQPIEATRTVGVLTSILGVAGFVTPPVFGWLADRVNRLLLLIAALFLSSLAFCATGLVTNVFGPLMIAVMVMIGLAEGAQAIASNALFAEEAPAHLRGSSMGLFVMLGTTSVLVVNTAGGYLFDRLGFSSPFLMEGLLNLFFFFAALFISRGRLGRGPTLENGDTDPTGAAPTADIQASA